MDIDIPSYLDAVKVPNDLYFSLTGISDRTGFGGVASGLDYLTQNQIGNNQMLCLRNGMQSESAGMPMKVETEPMENNMASWAADRAVGAVSAKGAAVLQTTSKIMQNGEDTGLRSVVNYNPDGSEVHTTINSNGEKDGQSYAEITDAHYMSAEYVSQETKGNPSGNYDRTQTFVNTQSRNDDGFKGWEHLVGPGLVISGQPWLEKRFIAPGSSPGTSIASKSLSKLLPFKSRFRLPSPIINSSRVGIVWTRSIGKFAGRWVPFIGWGLTIYDMYENRNEIIWGAQQLGNGMKERESLMKQYPYDMK